MDSVKFTRDYFQYDYETRTKKLVSRWHFDLKKNRNGPILVEEFDFEEKNTKKKKKKDTTGD